MSLCNNSPDKFSDILQVKRLSDYAILPSRGSPNAAGFDLSSAEDTVIKAGGMGVVKTDLSIACPDGTVSIVLM
jgi:dUTP pyrophosphatase